MEQPAFKKIKNALKATYQAQKKYIAHQEQEAKKKGLIKPILNAFSLEKALKAAARKFNKYYGNTSKYSPHQGKQECARRLRYGSAAYHSAHS